MKKQNTYSAVVLIVLTLLFVVYFSREAPQSSTASPSPQQQKEVADLKKQIAGLQERVNWLEERLVQPQRQKPSQF